MASPAPAAQPASAERAPVRVIDPNRGFSLVTNEIIRSRRLTLQELGTLTLVLGYAGSDGECWQSHEDLADFAGVTKRQLERHLHTLIERGFLDSRTRGRGQAKAYRRSERWRRVTRIPQHDTGVVLKGRNTTPVSSDQRVTVAANTTPVSAQHDIRVVLNTTPVSSPIEKNPEKNRKKGSSEKPGLVVAVAAAPIGTAAKRSRRAEKSDEGGTPPPNPETFELTPKLLAHGASLGYDAERVRLELYACLDHFGTKDPPVTKLDWVRTFRNWLTNERKRDINRAAQGTPTSYRGSGARNGSGEPQWTGKPGSATSTDARVFARRTDFDL